MKLDHIKTLVDKSILELKLIVTFSVNQIYENFCEFLLIINFIVIFTIFIS